MPLVTAVSPEVMVHGATVVRGYRTQSIAVRAVYQSYGRIRNMSMATGRWLTAEDDVQKQRVAVMGAEAAKKMFGEIPPEGEELTVNGLRFTVIGVLKTKTQISNYNEPDNECLFIPYETASLLRDIKYPDYIVWMPANPVFREQAVRQVRAVLARLHNFSPNDERAVRILVFNEFMRIVDTMGMALRILLGFIGTLTLAIGGVGLANIMLVSVTQRTREIGVEKALGARKRHILLQFLAEAMAITLAGGLVGIVISYAIAFGVGSLTLYSALAKHGEIGDIQLLIDFKTLLVATAILGVVGLISGMLPAIKAANLDPIEALHYE